MRRVELVLSLLLLSAACASSTRPDSRPRAAQPVPAGVELNGAPNGAREDVVATVDAALKKNGKLGAYGDLSAGIAELARSHSVRISVRADGYFVEAAPRAGSGHDLAFRVDPETLALLDLVVGEVAPAPEN